MSRHRLIWQLHRRHLRRALVGTVEEGCIGIAELDGRSSGVHAFTRASVAPENYDGAFFAASLVVINAV